MSYGSSLPDTLGPNGGLKVEVLASSVAATQADKAAFVEGTGIIDVIAGVYNETAAGDPSEDQAAAIRITAKRGAHTNLRKSDGTEISSGGYPNSDGNSGSTPTALAVGAFELQWNSAAWERRTGNLEGTLLASAARTATNSTADQTNRNCRGVRVSIDVSNIVSSPSITVAVETKDPVSGVYTAALTSAAITAAGHTELRVYPGITVAANLSVSDLLARTWRVTVTHGNANSITYSVGYSLIV